MILPCFRSEFRGDRAGALGVRIDHGDELRPRIERILLRMESAEIACAHHGDGDLRLIRQGALYLGRNDGTGDEVDCVGSEIRMHGKADDPL